MWNKPKPEDLAKIPPLYSQENTPLDKQIIHAHFFVGPCDWYISEFDGEDIMFGHANLGDDEMAEWGYVSFKELETVKVGPFEVEYDSHWKPTEAGKIEKIKT